MKLEKYKNFLGIKENERKKDWNDYDFVLSQIKQYGTALQFASEKLQDNEEIVKEAVSQNGYVLYYASEKLQNNEEIVLEAMKQNRRALTYASCNLQKEFIKNQPELIQYVKQTPELVKLAIDNGLKEKELIKISKEELFEYINSLNKKSIKP